jgi:FkbH-like protein
MPEITSIPNDVKLIIWDLDETFWKGTLSETRIEVVHGNAEIVRSLAARGILSSIASKNDHDAARKVLEQEDIWRYFIFPSISFDPKGKRVADIIKNAALRAENVLFVDDNILNLEEARFFNDGIMLAHPDDLIPGILDHPRLRGKPDPTLKRLRQYQLLERKLIDQKSTHISNEAFLRSSEISISFDFDVDANFERIIDLINRANQLNYTKIRYKTREQIEAFRSSINDYGVSAACISCRDKYGDYGIVGFYALKKNRKEFTLLHFVFSCRTMNMGIEQFVYEYLGRPQITIVPEVACHLDSHEKIDWIAVARMTEKSNTLIDSNKKLLLVGGCELLQLASFCSPNRIEFVNRTEILNDDEYVIRYDDPSFLLSDRGILKKSPEIKDLPAWTYEDAILLDHHLQDAPIIILSMREGLNHTYVCTKNAIHVRIPARNMQLYVSKRAEWFNANFTTVLFNMKDRLDLIGRSFEHVRDNSRKDATIFILGANTRNEFALEQATSSIYNQYCRNFCQENPDKCHFVDLDKIVPRGCLLDNRHFTRDGYYAVSKNIMEVLNLRSPP